MKIPSLFLACWLVSAAHGASLQPVAPRVEYLDAPLAVETSAPRLEWQLQPTDPAAKDLRQTAWRVIVSSSRVKLDLGEADVWDSGKVESAETTQVPYAGKPLASRQECFWKVKVWDQGGEESDWSAPGHWAMGLLKPEDWKAEWISFHDASPVHADRTKLELPVPRIYRKKVQLPKPAARAVVYASALGNYRLSVNDRRVSDAWFLPGWADYKQRALYHAFDLGQPGAGSELVFTATVSEGWYAGYVGYGLLVGYGPNKSGKNFYGKTPAFLAQIEVDYTDGSHQTIVTDATWDVTADGPTREADLIMGETYDARQSTQLEISRQPWRWEKAILAKDNGSVKATYHDTLGAREVELGFQKPATMQAHMGPPVRAIEELPAKAVTEPKPGVWIFDVGENIAGVVKLRVKGEAGTKVQLRYGEMLHADGTLMTENLRRARATDTYILKGNAAGEEWTPRFTYHGFRYVEVTGLPAKPPLDTITGLVLSSDTPYGGTFACSDEVMTQFWKNGVRTQKANFIEIPTDCPQRDERLGWMGDAMAYVRTASYNADVAAFFTKWIDDVREAQRDFGAYPDYCPYPMAHGAPGATHGTAWTDAGIIVPWTIWRVYGDTRVLAKHWESMTKFMDWRAKADAELQGVKLGNTWGDWLNVKEETPIEYVDICYHALVCRKMAEMARSLGKAEDAAKYDARHAAIKARFASRKDVPQTQSATILAVEAGLLEGEALHAARRAVVDRIAQNDFRMATGFLGTKALLPVLSSLGKHDLACRLFQSRKFPSWGYEVVNGATSVWERWDSYTKEFGFNGANGTNNAAMNSFSHYAFGAVMEWAYRDLAGIDAAEPGYRVIRLAPGIPAPNSNPDGKPISWVKATYPSPHGVIASEWEREGQTLTYRCTVPPNTTARLALLVQPEQTLGSGRHEFHVTLPDGR